MMNLKITGTTETEPDGLVALHAEAGGRDASFGPFDRHELLTALRAEPDETDYREVIEENNRLGRKLSAALRERDAARSERDEAREALRTAEGPRDDQDRLDRSWALEKAGEVIGRLAAVGVDARACGVSLLPLAEWILGGEQVDRG